MKAKKIKKLYKKIVVSFVMFAMFGPSLNQAGMAFASTNPVGSQDQVTSQDKKNIIKAAKENPNSVETLPKDKKYAPNEILVKFKKDVNLSEKEGGLKASNFAKSKNLNKQKDFKQYNISLLELRDSKTSLSSKIAELKKDPNVEFVQPNFQYKALSGSTDLSAIDDTDKSYQWALHNDGEPMVVNGQVISKTASSDINVAGAWNVTGGQDASVTVAIIDNGVAYRQPDLEANMWSAEAGSCYDQYGDVMTDGNGDPIGCEFGQSFVYGVGDVSPVASPDGAYLASHGTHIAGIIGAVQNNTRGIAGVAKNVKIMALKSDLTTESILDAISFANYNGAKVINASWGSYDFDEALLDAIEDFDGLFVAAAGNEASDNDDSDWTTYPCAYSSYLSNVMCVAATDENDRLAEFSNYGNNTVDIAAPGTHIYSSLATTNIASENFTSVVAPALPVGFSKTDPNGGLAGTGDSTIAVVGGIDLDSVALFGDTNRLPYTDNNNSLTTSDAIDLSSLSASDLPSIDFLANCDTEYGTSSYADYGIFKVSKDGENFDTLFMNDGWGDSPMAFDEYTLDSMNGDFDPTENAVYRFVDVPLADKYLTSDFKYGYRWLTNSTDNNYDGCSIDDVVVKKISDGTGDGTNNNNYDYWDGTSMAAPFVAGVAALAWSYDENLSAWDVRQIIKANGREVESLSGKISSGSRLDAAGVISYLQGAKKITDFNFSFQDGLGYNAYINEDTHTIYATVPYIFKDMLGAQSLLPSIKFEGVSISPDLLSSPDFYSPVTYTVTAGDGTTQDYTVITNVGPGITDFSFPNSTEDLRYYDADMMEHIIVSVPHGTDLTSLIPDITTDGSGEVDVYPALGEAQDFSDSIDSPIFYSVSRDNGEDYGDPDSGGGRYDEARFLVTVREMPGISSFTFAGIDSSITSTSIDSNRDNHIYINVQSGADLANLTPNISYSDSGQWDFTYITPDTGIVNDFSDTVRYVLTWEDTVTSRVIEQNFYIHVTRKDSFSNSEVSFSSKDVSSKKTTAKEKVKINFDNVGNATDYKVSRNSDFEGANWKSMDGGIKVTLKKKSGKQSFYIKFKDEFGSESEVFKKTIRYVGANRVIKNSRNNVPQGSVLVQSGKHFSKNSKVALYFSKPNGTYYSPQEVSTDNKGTFAISFKASKAKGKYKWYAIDLKTGKKSKVIKYEIK